MKFFAYLIIPFLVSSIYAVDVLVDTLGGSAAPYYSFTTDDGATNFDFINDGSDNIVAGTQYNFTGNNASHPFRMYITDNSTGTETNLVNNLSARQTQSFTLDPSIDYTGYTATYVCNAHSYMNGTFNIIPEPSNYALILGALAIGLVAIRRRYSS